MTSEHANAAPQDKELSPIGRDTRHTGWFPRSMLRPRQTHPNIYTNTARHAPGADRTAQAAAALHAPDAKQIVRATARDVASITRRTPSAPTVAGTNTVRCGKCIGAAIYPGNAVGRAHITSTGRPGASDERARVYPPLRRVFLATYGGFWTPKCSKNVKKCPQAGPASGQPVAVARISKRERGREREGPTNLIIAWRESEPGVACCVCVDVW
eukprot:gene11648-biopygen10926